MVTTLNLHQDFREFLSLLNAHDVKYLMLGGYAVVYYGYPRSTGDLDIWISRDSNNALAVVKVIREFGFPLPDTAQTEFEEPEKIFRMGVPPVRLEVMTSVSGLEFEPAYAKRKSIQIEGGILVPMISLEDLKTNKKASARPKDLEDLKQLP